MTKPKTTYPAIGSPDDEEDGFEGLSEEGQAAMDKVIDRARTLAVKASTLVSTFSDDAAHCGLLFPLATLGAISNRNSNVRPLPPDLLAVAASARSAYIVISSHDLDKLAFVALAISDALIGLALAFDADWQRANAILDKADESMARALPASDEAIPMQPPPKADFGLN